MKTLTCLIMFVALLAACGGKVDTQVTTVSTTIYFTAPGDDGDSIGCATTYDFRYSTEATLTEAAWPTAKQVTGEPVPKCAGAKETVFVSGLPYATKIFFALKTIDDVGNTSPSTT